MKLLFIQTGGTIDKDYPKKMGGWAFEIKDPAVKRILKKINPSFEYDIQTATQKDSLEINEIDRKLIYKMCDKAKENKIIITHGTDSIIETANFLSTIKKKTIVITGSMRPERFTNSDAGINIGLAIGGVQSLKQGVYIALNGLLIPQNKIKRNMETGKYEKK
jgi:L-asparaginase